MADWQVYKPLGQCSATGEPIASGEEYYGALIETPEGFERRDYCVAYWEKEKPEVFCYWKTRLPHPEQKKQIFVDDNMLMAFFERLAEETEPEKMNFRYVLALVLMRKRRLKYNATDQKDGQEIWRLRVTGENRIVNVVNPHLDEQQIEQLSSQIGKVLQTDL